MKKFCCTKFREVARKISQRKLSYAARFIHPNLDKPEPKSFQSAAADQFLVTRKNIFVISKEERLRNLSGILKISPCSRNDNSDFWTSSSTLLKYSAKYYTYFTDKVIIFVQGDLFPSLVL